MKSNTAKCILIFVIAYILYHLITNFSVYKLGMLVLLVVVASLVTVFHHYVRE